MTKTTVQTQNNPLQHGMNLEQGSLRGYNFSSSAFIDLASQYCKIFNNEFANKYSDCEKLFGTLRLQLNLMPDMDIVFFAYNDPASKLSGKTIQSAATTLRHGDLALQVKDLCGIEPGNLVTEIMLKARESGIKYLILDLPRQQLVNSVSKLGMNEPDANISSPLILKIQGAYPQVASRQEFLNEPGAGNVDINNTVMYQAMRRMETSVDQINSLMDKLAAVYSLRSPQRK